ncbi:DUF1028 domain-containing protein [Leucobacter celer]|uniref:DUF1028 domain-containing protein n=1 Tax=Leucobacter celer TaxID=668625 RepID=UPI0006A7E330|nr:DUF1028 domain-containing protein [Leucobacter celer]
MTYTILASDPDRHLLGVATASRSLAVGAGVPALRVGVGAVASQAYTNRALRGFVLDALAAGRAPADVVAQLPEVDTGSARRQVAVIDAAGRIAVHTGSGCTAWAGSATGDGFAVIGNLLAGPAVLDAMAAEFGAWPRTGSGEGAAADGAAFARRLLAALSAGEGAGGDLRGRQSAALLVGAGTATAGSDGSLAFDLRVDDHEQPVRELGRLLGKAVSEPAP